MRGLDRWLLGGLAALCLAATSGSSMAEDRALLIGIDKYPNLPNGLQLTGSVNDAKFLANVARDLWGFAPDQIKLLLDQQATASNIRAAIEDWLIKGTQSGDRVLLTFSGHGYYARDVSGDEPSGYDETIAAHDVRREGGAFLNMILDDEISRSLARLAGRTVMLIVDSCHSGTITRALNAPPQTGPMIVRSLSIGQQTRGVNHEQYDAIRKGKPFGAGHGHVMAWTAAAPTELAQEDLSLPEGKRQGVFTRAFIDGLLGRRADANGNGIVSPNELLGYLRERASDYCSRYACRTGMTPTLELAAGLAGVDLLSWRGQPKMVVASGARPPPAPPVLDATDIIPFGGSIGARLEILPSERVKLGEDIKLRVTSPVEGYLIVLDVRDDGQVVQLFPSRCTRSERRVRAGLPLTLPDATYGCRFVATEPGRGQILVIVTKDNVPVDSLLERHRDLEIVPNGRDHLSAIAQSLLRVWTGDARNRPVSWGLVAARYEVTR